MAINSGTVRAQLHRFNASLPDFRARRTGALQPASGTFAAPRAANRIATACAGTDHAWRYLTCSSVHWRYSHNSNAQNLLRYVRCGKRIPSLRCITERTVHVAARP